MSAQGFNRSEPSTFVHSKCQAPWARKPWARSGSRICRRGTSNLVSACSQHTLSVDCSQSIFAGRWTQKARTVEPRKLRPEIVQLRGAAFHESTADGAGEERGRAEIMSPVACGNTPPEPRIDLPRELLMIRKADKGFAAFAMPHLELPPKFLPSGFRSVSSSATKDSLTCPSFPTKVRRSNSLRAKGKS